MQFQFSFAFTDGTTSCIGSKKGSTGPKTWRHLLTRTGTKLHTYTVQEDKFFPKDQNVVGKKSMRAVVFFENFQEETFLWEITREAAA